MASTYSTNLRIEKMADGENSTTWGSKTNTNWDLIEQAVSGVASVAMTDADYTLTTNNALADEARNAVVTMTGTLTQARNVIVPPVDKQYVFKNSTTGGFSIVVKTSGGTGVTIPNGETVQVYCDATNVLLAETGGATTTILVGGGVGSVPVWTTATGSGAPVRATSPTLVTPALGVATATSINALTLAANTNYNITIGEGTALPSSSGSDNIAIGRDAGDSMTTGSNCIAIGRNALTANDAAAGVIAIGTGAASTLSGAGAFGHICIGQNAGSGLTNFSEGNTIIGYTAGTTLAGGDNNTVIGWSAESSAAGVSNEITLGNSSIATLRCQVTSITALSDARDKTDVVPLPSGIDTVMALNPVRFTWNMRDGGKVGVKDAGFIAQELQAVDDEYLRLVYAENPEKLEASYGRLIPVLVKAIQELQQQINEMKGVAP